MKTLSIFICLLLLSALSFEGVASEYQVIAHAQFPSDSISKSELRKLFLLKKKYYLSTQVLVTNLSKDNAARISFSLDVLRKNAVNMERYYFKRALSGKSVALEPLDSESDLIKKVQSNSGAIGYVGAESDTSGVKVLKVK